MTTNQIMNTISLALALAFVVWLVVHQAKKRRQRKAITQQHAPNAPETGIDPHAIARMNVDSERWS